MPANENAAIVIKAAALDQQTADYQTKVSQATADQQAAEKQAAALSLDAKAAQDDLNAKSAP